MLPGPLPLIREEVRQASEIIPGVSSGPKSIKKTSRRRRRYRTARKSMREVKTTPPPRILPRVNFEGRKVHTQDRHAKKMACRARERIKVRNHHMRQGGHERRGKGPAFNFMKRSKPPIRLCEDRRRTREHEKRRGKAYKCDVAGDGPPPRPQPLSTSHLGKGYSCDVAGDGPTERKRNDVVYMCECKLGSACTHHSHWHKKAPKKGAARRTAEKNKVTKRNCRPCTFAPHECENMDCHYHTPLKAPKGRSSTTILQPRAMPASVRSAMNTKMSINESPRTPLATGEEAFASSSYDFRHHPHYISPPAPVSASQAPCRGYSRLPTTAVTTQRLRPPLPARARGHLVPPAPTLPPVAAPNAAMQAAPPPPPHRLNPGAQAFVPGGFRPLIPLAPPLPVNLIVPPVAPRAPAVVLPLALCQARLALRHIAPPPIPVPGGAPTPVIYTTQMKRIYIHTDEASERLIDDHWYYNTWFKIMARLRGAKHQRSRLKENTLNVIQSDGVETRIVNNSAVQSVRQFWLLRVLGASEYVYDKNTRAHVFSPFLKRYSKYYDGRVYTDVAKRVMDHHEIVKYTSARGDGTFNPNLESAIIRVMEMEGSKKELKMYMEVWMNTFMFVCNRLFLSGLWAKSSTIVNKKVLLNESSGPTDLVDRFGPPSNGGPLNA